MNVNTAQYWDKKWASQWQAYSRDPRRDALYQAILSELPEVRTILDLGGGCSRFSKLAKGAGHNPTVADLSPWAIQHMAANGIDGVVLDVDKDSGDTLSKFDVAVCTELLEHLDSPHSALRILSAHAPEAWVSVPANRMGPQDCNEHQRTYTLADFIGLLQKYYHVVSAKDVHGYYLAHVSKPQDLPEVSVLIPSIGRPTLMRTVDSLLKQSFTRWEAFVVFNNAKDNPAASINDPRLNFIDLGNIKNDTGATARNEGFKRTRGTLIAILDDDDWWEKSFLWVMRREMQAKGVDLLYCRTTLWDRTGNERYGTWLKEFDGDLLKRAGYILSPSVIFRRKMLENYVLNADGSGRNSDWRFYIDRYKAGYTFASVDRTLSSLCVDWKIWHHWAPGGFRAK